MKKVVFSLCFLLLSFGSNAFEAEKYFKMNCASCHTIGEGDKTGPDLAGVSKRRKIEWLVKFAKYPMGMIEGDPEEAGYEKADPVAQRLAALYKPATMNEFNDMDKAKMEAILKYIDAQNKQPKGKITTFK